MTIREIEYLVAEKVFGWKWYRWSTELWSYPIPEYVREDRAYERRFLRHPSNANCPAYVLATGDEPLAADHYDWIPPRFARDAHDTRKLKTKLIADRNTINLFGFNDYWCASINSSFKATAPTEELALCLAALAYCGCEIRIEDIG
jgi:hypothetical protein